LQGGSRYEDWALDKECNMVETLQEFPSVQVTADLLLTQLPALQPVSRQFEMNINAIELFVYLFAFKFVHFFVCFCISREY